MAIYRAATGKSAKQQTSSENQFTSNSVYDADQIQSGAFDAIRFDSSFEHASKHFMHKSSSVIVSTALSGQSFSDIFYDSVHFTYQGSIVDGQIFDQGIVSQDNALVFGIWNAFFHENTLEIVAATAGQGVNVTTPNPGTVIQGLQEIPLIVEVSASGPAIFTALISVKLTGRPEIYSFTIKGTRLAIPYFLDAEWASGLEVTKRYLTATHIAQDRSESRVSTRSNPVRQVRAPMFFTGKRTALQMWTSIHNAATSQFVMPFVPDRSFVNAPGTVAKTIYIDTQYKRFNAGNYAVAVRLTTDLRVEYQEVIRIAEVYSDRIVAQDGLLFSYDQGDSLFPAMICMPAISGSKSTLSTDRVGSFTLEARETYGSTQLNIENSEYTPLELSGHPVYPFDINWKEAVESSIEIGGAITTSGSGNQFYTLGPSPSYAKTVTSAFIGREQMWEGQGFFNHIRGRAKSFWAKGEEDLFEVVSIAGGGGTQLIIRINDDVNTIDLLSMEYLWLKDENDVLYILKIEDRVEAGGFLDILTETTSATSIKDIFPAMLVRLTSDEITETYLTDSLSEIRVTMREVVSGYE